MGGIGDWFEENVTQPVKEFGGKAYKGAVDVGRYAFTPITATKGAYDALNKGGAYAGLNTPEMVEMKKSRTAAEASAQAAVRQAEYEEQAARGTERNRARRRRGFQSTILTGGSKSLGASGTGKTLLGD